MHRYYGDEQDVSFCIVSEVLVSRMTRWQLVFEDYYRDKAIWLGRGAPLAWFSPSVNGFNVTNAPTRVGHVSYSVTASSDTVSVYSVDVSLKTGVSTDSVPWVVRFPVGPAHKGVQPTCVTGCTVANVDTEHGIVTVTPTGSHFEVQGQLV